MNSEEKQTEGRERGK